MAAKKSSKSTAARTDDDRTRVFPSFSPSAGSRAPFAESATTPPAAGDHTAPPKTTPQQPSQG